MKQHRFDTHVFAPSLVLLMALGGVLFLSHSQAEACDACNIRHLERLLEEDMETLASRDILTAAQNQRGLPLHGFSNIQEVSENMLDRHFATSSMPTETPINSQPADNNPGVVGPGEFDIDRVKERDAELDIPLTGHVDQDIEADHSVHLQLNEGETYLGNGVMYDGFLINGKIPGPTITVNQGDVVEFLVENTGSIPHGASIHSAYTQTSAYLGQIAPGSTNSIKFRATYPGVFMYHCAPGGHAIPTHVMGGQYGMMVVKPTETKYKLEEELGHEPDIEIHLVQHELYGSGADAVEGNADYTMFNGRLFRYVEEPIVARPGDYVRMYFINMGPNLLSTFHLVGIIWDYAYWQGHPEAVVPGGQTVTAGPSDSWVVEFRIPPEEGAYTMLSHAVGSTSRGAIGLLVADESADKPETVLADGPEYTEAELAEYAANATRKLSPFGIGTATADRPVRFSDPEEEVFVDIKGNSYSPKVIEVPVGTTVTWVNDDVFTYLQGEFSGLHDVVVVDGPERFASSMLQHGEAFSHTFEEVGEYEYMCTPHPYMRGRVKVYEPATVEVDAENQGGGGLGVGAVIGLALIAALAVAIGTNIVMRGGSKQ